MSNALEQLHVTYNPAQDRLLLRASSDSEFRVWLTRRYSELLLGALEDLMDKEGGMQRLMSREETLDKLKNGALSQREGSPDDPPSETPLPLGADGILGHRITYNRERPGHIVLQLLPEQGPGLNMNLTPTMLYMFYNMLEQGVIQADWKIRSASRLRDPVH